MLGSHVAANPAARVDAGIPAFLVRPHPRLRPGDGAVDRARFRVVADDGRGGAAYPGRRARRSAGVPVRRHRLCRGGGGRQPGHRTDRGAHRLPHVLADRHCAVRRRLRGVRAVEQHRHARRRPGHPGAGRGRAVLGVAHPGAADHRPRRAHRPHADVQRRPVRPDHHRALDLRRGARIQRVARDLLAGAAAGGGGLAGDVLPAARRHQPRTAPRAGHTRRRRPRAAWTGSAWARSRSARWRS